MSKKVNILLNRLMAIGVAGTLILGSGAPVRADGEESNPEGISDVAQAVKMTVEDATVDDSYYNLVLGGEVFATFEKEYDAQGIIDCIEDHFVFDDMMDAKLTFYPELTVEKLPLEGANPKFDTDVNEVITRLMRGGSDKQNYVTVEGDSIGGIADVFGVEVERLEALNPDVDLENLEEGTLLSIRPAQPLLTIRVEYQEEREKEIDFNKVEEETEDLLSGEKVVYQEGEKGFAITQDRVVKVNGIEESREELSREVVWEAQDEIIMVGTGEPEEDYDEESEEGDWEEEYVEEDYEEETYEEETYEEETYDEESSQEESEPERSVAAPAEPTGDAYEEGLRIANYALQFIGNPYSWGGTSLTNGCDCSGFVYRVYQDCGYNVNRYPETSSSAYVVSNSELQPGDVICYPHHNALYIGNGQCVEALNYEKGICICPLGYSDSYYYAVRIVR